MPEQENPTICDYEGSTYRTDFWEGKGREYEDRVERIAIRRLLPPTGDRIMEVGAGFGRLAPLYAGYRQVVLLDYSRSQLEFARQQYGDERFLYVAANVYQMPFAPRAFDQVIMVRVLHHMQDPLAALQSIRRTMQQGGTFVLEFANKRNLKAIIRWLLRRQSWNPFERQPVEFAELNYDFHPRYVRETLLTAGFQPGRTLAVSYFRLGLLKRIVPPAILSTFDSLLQPTGNLFQFSPSVFLRSEAVGEDEPVPAGAFWRCPICGSYSLDEALDSLICRGCNKKWAKRQGIYDFKEPAGE
jgi:SAM-dependent methyltransferase